jgi:hypothetical protein
MFANLSKKKKYQSFLCDVMQAVCDEIRQFLMTLFTTVQLNVPRGEKSISYSQL